MDLTIGIYAAKRVWVDPTAGETTAGETAIEAFLEVGYTGYYIWKRGETAGF